MLNILDDEKFAKCVESNNLYDEIGLAKTQYKRWCTSTLMSYGTQGTDYYNFNTMLKLTATNPKKIIVYRLTVNFAKELCMIARTEKAKEIRQYLISLSDKRETLELVTIKEAAFAMKVVNCLKYIENQKEAYTIHKDSFVKENNDNVSPRFIYSEFAKYRAKIVGWDKEKTDKAILEYINNHSGYNRTKIMKTDMPTKLSVMDIGEAIRVAVLDILYSKNEDSDIAENFSILCKNLAKEMQVIPTKENSKNLFKDKEQIDSVKMITLNK
jgi:phage anti-repressor protein